jgi:hypothetical protein
MDASLIMVRQPKRVMADAVICMMVENKRL